MNPILEKVKIIFLGNNHTINSTFGCIYMPKLRIQSIYEDEMGKFQTYREVLESSF